MAGYFVMLALAGVGMGLIAIIGLPGLMIHYYRKLRTGSAARKDRT